MKKVLGFCSELEFFIKVALACVLLQQLFHLLFGGIQVRFAVQVLLYWIAGSASFYAIGFFIEEVLKKNERLRAKLNVRVVKVKPQPYPRFTAKGIIIGEVRAVLVACAILYLAPEVHRGNGLLLNLGWFLMRIFVFDFLFYVAHWALHRKPLRWIHLKHHEYRDSSTWIATHKTTIEYIIIGIIDALPLFLFGYDITQLCAWAIITNAYSLEGHSTLSIFFISSDFHDLHHTAFHGNYGIQGLWDRVFGTLNPPTRKRGLLFPIASLEAGVSERKEG